MHPQADTSLKPRGRLRLVFQHLNDRRPLHELAAEAGMSLRYGHQ